MGHNILGFDAKVLNGILGPCIDQLLCIDTLVVSRLLNYSIGSHSLEAWGLRLNCPKTAFSDYSTLTPEMIAYCQRDVRVLHKLYEHLKPYIESPQWADAIRTELETFIACEEMHENGFCFDKEGALELSVEIKTKLEALDATLEKAFPPKAQLIREILPKETKHGTLSKSDFRWLGSDDLTSFLPGCVFSLVEWVPFNPASPKQIVERLNAAGWLPTEKTKGHVDTEKALRYSRGEEKERLQRRLEEYRKTGWKVSEENLRTLPDTAPEAAKSLATRLILASRLSDLEEWLALYDENTQRIHGNFLHIGAWTQRMSHQKPNMANIPTGDPYGRDMRALWCAAPGKVLVGVDAEGIQLRVLAHYLDDPIFTDAIESGDKNQGTDVHSLNMKALGSVCKDRDAAKTFIYSWLLGAATPRTAKVLNCSMGAAKKARDNFLEAYPGLKHLREYQIPEDANRGYFKGLDGRLVLCNNEHKMLSGYLQNGEAVIMKRALQHWSTHLKREKIPYNLVDFVHDEWVTEVHPEVADYVKEVQINSFAFVGQELGLKCKLTGSGSIGNNWYEVH